MAVPQLAKGFEQYDRRRLVALEENEHIVWQDSQISLVSTVYRPLYEECSFPSFERKAAQFLVAIGSHSKSGCNRKCLLCS